MHRRLLAALMLVGGLMAGVVGTPPASAAPTAFAVNGNDLQLYSIDLATGTATVIGPTGVGRIQGVAFRADGTLFGTDVVNDTLVTIDTTTGVATLVGALTVDVNNTGLTFGPDGRLWMSEEFGVGPNYNFYRVDPVTGTATLVAGPVSGAIPTGLTADCAGTIYAIDQINDVLGTINTSTGAFTTVGAFGTVDLGGGGLDFAADGTLWGVNRVLPSQTFTIDRSTGAATVVANTDQGFDGLAIAPLSCPTPAAAPVPAAPTFTG